MKNVILYLTFIGIAITPSNYSAIGHGGVSSLK